MIPNYLLILIQQLGTLFLFLVLVGVMNCQLLTQDLLLMVDYIPPPTAPSLIFEAVEQGECDM